MDIKADVLAKKPKLRNDGLMTSLTKVMYFESSLKCSALTSSCFFTVLSNSAVMTFELSSCGYAQQLAYGGLDSYIQSLVG